MSDEKKIIDPKRKAAVSAFKKELDNGPTLKELKQQLPDPKVVTLKKERKKPKTAFTKQKEFRVGQNKKKIEWYIMFYEEIDTPHQPYEDGEVIARLDVVYVKVGIILQNVAQVKFDDGHVFMLPNYRQNLIREGRIKTLPYLRFQKRRNSDMFQLAMEELVEELLINNPDHFRTGRCKPQIPDATRQRSFELIKECQERARLKKLGLPQPAKIDLSNTTT